MASVAAGIYAVEEVHAPVYRLQDIGRRSHAHQIGGLVLGKIRRHRLDDSVHILMGLAYCQSADGVAVQIHLRNLLGVLDPDILINRSLVDSKQQLVLVDGVRKAVQPLHFRLTAGKPAGGAGHGFLYIIPLRQGRSALVEGHGNGGGQIGLNLHTLLRSHENLPSVNMGVKIYALFLYFA